MFTLGNNQSQRVLFDVLGGFKSSAYLLLALTKTAIQRTDNMASKIFSQVSLYNDFRDIFFSDPLNELRQTYCRLLL
ncbi:Hypothetical predicted protein [Octopus vulgaris]|uniref:Uncharacterized protein n=1 Tax=Octopus vulgaris TaxID=6645 RepID=A0AA36B584_OCTVU|nr:Hypothetical predicted protein [Octopus vulgaris]